MADSVDPQVRLQNIALETQELLQQRSMAWTETSNRATMLMTVVGASVFALALVGNAVRFDQSFLMFAAVVLAVVLLVGLTTLGRIGELDVSIGSGSRGSTGCVMRGSSWTRASTDTSSVVPTTTLRRFSKRMRPNR